MMKKMISQFSSRKYRITSRGKIALERKEEMKKRGLQSPDRADAIVLAFYKPKVVMGGKVKECSRTFIVRLFLCSLLIEERRTHKRYERQENHKECKSIWY